MLRYCWHSLLGCPACRGRLMSPIRAAPCMGPFNLDIGEISGGGDSVDFDGFAITGEAEYLVWDEGLSVFGGARYANREISEGGDSIDVDDLQVFVGLEFAFGAAGSSLAGRDRSGPVDNTSVMFEKLPDFFTSLIAASAGVP